MNGCSTALWPLLCLPPSPVYLPHPSLTSTSFVLSCGTLWSFTFSIFIFLIPTCLPLIRQWLWCIREHRIIWFIIIINLLLGIRKGELKFVKVSMAYKYHLKVPKRNTTKQYKSHCCSFYMNPWVLSFFSSICPWRWYLSHTYRFCFLGFLSICKYFLEQLLKPWSLELQVCSRAPG